MERVQRMKTAISLQDQIRPEQKRPMPSVGNLLASQSGQFRVGSLVVLAAAAVTTFALGLSLPEAAFAQDASARTIATGSAIPLAADAPDRYTVKKGDTLWDISKVFLRDPWYWPEIWYVNPQVKNPHLIYPGDVLALTSVNGRPQVSIAERGPEGAAAASEDTGPMRTGSGVRLSPRVRSQPITAAVTAVPYDAISAFMGRPSLLTAAQVKSGPYIVGMRDFHTIGSAGNDLYAHGIRNAPEGARYNIVHVDEPMRDPKSKKILGYRGIFVGTGTVTAPGQVAKLRADVTEREALRGDKLFAEDVAIPLDFIPHPAPESVKGAIMAVEGVSIAGKYNVVAINRGTQQGVEPGQVLAIKQKGEVERDHYSNGGADSYWSIGKKVKLPDERVGVIMVFKAYDRMSYALIMEATHPVRIGDYVGAP
jgi:LysM repeat protein